MNNNRPKQKTGELAEHYVKNYFANRKREPVKLERASKGELGYDYRDKKGKLFIEVKGTQAATFSKINFRYFTNTEYEKARACQRAGQDYQIHLVVGVRSRKKKHYQISGRELLKKAKPEIIWSLPIRKDLKYILLAG